MSSCIGVLASLAITRQNHMLQKWAGEERLVGDRTGTLGNVTFEGTLQGIAFLGIN